MSLRRFVLAATSALVLVAVPIGAQTAGASGGGGGGASVTVTSLNTGTTTPAAGSTGTMDVVLSAAAPTGGSVVTLTSSNSTALSLPASVAVAAGQQVGDFTYSAGAVTTSTSVTLSAKLGASASSATVTVTPVSLFSLNFGPGNDVQAGSSVSVEPDLSGPAPPGGAIVSLTSSSPSLLPVPATATIPAGQFIVSVPVTTGNVIAVTDVTVTASWNGTTLSGVLEIDPPPPPPPSVIPSSVTFNTTFVFGSAGSTGTLTLSAAAPAGGTTVQLQSTDTAVATVPGSVTVPSGATSTTFAVTTTPPPSTDENITVSASLGGTVYASGQVTVISLSIESITLSPAGLAGGGTSTATVQLFGPAPAGGAVIPLASGTTSAATVPTSVTIPAGATTATFTVTTLKVATTTPVSIGGAYGGFSKAALLTVTGAKGSALSLPPSGEFPEPSQLDLTPEGARVQIDFDMGGTLDILTISLASGSLPPGLSIIQGVGVGGQPSTQGLYAFVLKYTDGSVVLAWPFVWQIGTPAPLHVSEISLPAGTVGTAYDGGFFFGGGVPPYSWSIVSGALPPGLNINTTTSEISGKPNKAGTFSFTAQLKDSIGETLSTPTSITINAS